MLVGYVEHLGAALKGLGDEVRHVESRQVKLDRRLTEFGGLLQGMQEEQLSHGSQAATLGAQRALNTAVAVQKHVEQEVEVQACLDGFTDGVAKRLEKCCEQHGRWLRELASEVAALGGHVKGGGKASGPQKGSHLSNDAGLSGRIVALEQGQKTVAVGARRALHTALVVHQQQQSQDHDDQWEKCLDALPVADLELQFTRRFTEQDTRLDKVIHMVDTLADRLMMQQELTEGRSDTRSLRRLRDRVEAIEVSVREKVDEIESNIEGLASDLERHGPSHADLQAVGAAPENLRQFMSVAIESLEARLDRHFSEVGQQIELLQDGREQQRLALRQIGQQLPEVAHKLDQLWAQCQYYFPRVKEHDVHFSFFRTSFETHKQSWLDHADGLELREHRVAANLSESRPLSPAGASPLFTQAPSVASPPAAMQLGPTSSMRNNTSLLSTGVAGAVASAAPPSQGFGSLSAPGGGSMLSSLAPASYLDQTAVTSSSSVVKAGTSAAARALAEDDAELGTRQRMLQQVMARLHSDGPPGT